MKILANTVVIRNFLTKAHKMNSQIHAQLMLNTKIYKNNMKIIISEWSYFKL